MQRRKIRTRVRRPACAYTGRIEKAVPIHEDRVWHSVIRRTNPHKGPGPQAWA